ncbi:NAD-dependent epimerase/dehydratase family protein [Nocardiopsis salina]|uniref:NAD-dependent epimerase/dehydratase family protein n=1 Tax=Nocardiopsis salina TaxID=245836 RepID=UPI0003748260|nr:NAD(P)-dependent oxidoreductase [Nocardiopsis salina]
MKLLVTGGGTVGTAVARAARSRGAQVLVVDARGLDTELDSVRCDVTDTAALLSVFTEWAPDHVVHTAGIIGRKVDTAPPLAVGVNVTGTVSVLECARRSSVEHVVLASSLAVYDWSRIDPDDGPIQEDAAGRPTSLYGASKIAAETLAGQFARSGGPAVSVLRFAGVYGLHGGGGGALLSSALSNIIRRSIRGQEVTLPPFMGCTEYLNAVDAAHAVLLALDTGTSPWRVLNVGAGRVHGADEVAELLRWAVPGARIGVPPTSRFLPPLDLARARSELGYAPQVDLQDGIAELAEAIRRDEETACTN